LKSPTIILLFSKEYDTFARDEALIPCCSIQSFDEKEGRGSMLMFLSVLQTVLLLLIAVGTGYLVYRSSRSARGTRKSLHARRSEVYKDVVRILTLLGQKGDLRKEELLDFRSRTQDAALLFDEEIAAYHIYIEEIYTRGVKLMSTSEILKGNELPIGDERDQVTVENAKQLIWLADQIALVKKKFHDYPDVE
jgi:hypothetical protein